MAEPHPTTLATLDRLGYETGRLRTKGWDEFAKPGSPSIDFVLTVCDNAAGESCPVWPGRPITAHWGVEDPAAFEGPPDQESAFFERIHHELFAKIEALVALALDELSPETLAHRLEEIGGR